MVEVIEIPVGSVVPSPFQPREGFPKAELEELAASLESLDMIQPIVVRPKGDGHQIACGERRWRAAQMAGWDTILAIVRDLDDKQLQLYSLVENFHRQNLTSHEREKGLYDLWRAHYNRPGGKAAMARALGLSETTIQHAIYAHDERLKIRLGEEELERITTKDIAETRGLSETVAHRALEAKAKGELDASELEDIAPVLRGSQTKVAEEFLEDYLAEKRAVRAEVESAKRIMEGKAELSKELRRQLSADEKRLEDFADIYAKVRFWTMAAVEMIETASLRRKAAEYVEGVAQHCSTLVRALRERDWY